MDIDTFIARDVGTLIGRSVGIGLAVLFFVWVKRRFGTVDTARNSSQQSGLDDIIMANENRASASDDATFFGNLPKTVESAARSEAKLEPPLLVPLMAYPRVERTPTRRSGASKRRRLCAYLSCSLLFAAGILVGAFFSLPIMATLGFKDGLNSPTPTATIAPVPTLSSDASDPTSPDTGANRIEPVATTTQEARFQQQQESCDTTLDMITCMNRIYQISDRTLNKTYNDLLALLASFDDDLRDVTRSSNQKIMLVDAQRAWIVFRDKECERVYWSGGGGTIAPILRLNCLVDLTEKRTTELRAYVNEGQ